MGEISYRPVTPAIADELRGLVGAPYVLYGDPEKLEPFSHDEIPGKHYRAMPEAVVRPDGAAQVAAILKLANRERIPVTPRGAGSGLSGGAVPVHGGIVLSVDRMNRILEIDRDNLMAVVEPGVVTNEINERIKELGLFYAGYPMSLETCFIGGNVAENAGGGKAVKYGVTARYVLGLEVVTPTGEIVELGGKLVKDVTGYNLVQLMVGSEGTLGIFTKIILKLIPLPKCQVDLLCLFRGSEAAIAAVPKLMTESGIVPTAVEYMDRLAVKGACDYLNETIPYQECGAMLLLSLDGATESEVVADYEASASCASSTAPTRFMSPTIPRPRNGFGASGAPSARPITCIPSARAARTWWCRPPPFPRWWPPWAGSARPTASWSPVSAMPATATSMPG